MTETYNRRWYSSKTPRISRVREIYNEDKARYEMQVDLARNGEWFPVYAEPGMPIHDHFVAPNLLAVGLGIIFGNRPWSWAAGGGGTVAAANIPMGGIILGAPGANDDSFMSLGGAAVFPFTLEMEPHIWFNGQLGALNATFVGDLGFYSAAYADEIELTYRDEAINLLLKNSLGGTTVIPVPGETPDTEFHDWMLRFGDDGVNGPGSRCDVIVDGVLRLTVDAADYPDYPALTTQMDIHVRARDVAGAGGFTETIRHFNLLMDR